MNKRKKLEYLHHRIDVESQRISVLLEYLMFSDARELHKNVLAEIAQEKADVINKITNKITKILKY